MKTFGILLAMLFVSLAASAQNSANATFHVANVKVSDGIGDMEILEVKITRPIANEVPGMSLDFVNGRAATVPMTRTTTEAGNGNGNSANNANETWVATVDLDLYADSSGDVLFNLTPPCCYIPQGGIVVRSKGR